MSDEIRIDTDLNYRLSVDVPAIAERVRNRVDEGDLNLDELLGDALVHAFAAGAKAAQAELAADLQRHGITLLVHHEGIDLPDL